MLAKSKLLHKSKNYYKNFDFWGEEIRNISEKLRLSSQNKLPSKINFNKIKICQLLIQTSIEFIVFKRTLTAIQLQLNMVCWIELEWSCNNGKQDRLELILFFFLLNSHWHFWSKFISFHYESAQGIIGVSKEAKLLGNFKSVSFMQPGPCIVRFLGLKKSRIKVNFSISEYSRNDDLFAYLELFFKYHTSGISH